MKKLLAQVVVLFFAFLNVFYPALSNAASCPLNCDDNQNLQTNADCDSCCQENNNCEKFFPNKCTFDTQREKIYAQLCLTETQVCQIQRLDDEYALRFKCYEEKICLKKRKLQELEKCSPCSFEAKELKNDIKQFRREFRCERKEYEKRFLCLLSKSQKRDYKRMKKEIKKCNKALKKAKKQCNVCN